MRDIQASVDEKYDYTFMSPGQLRKYIPAIGPKVIGACYTPMDGHANPLKLLPALQRGARQLGVDYRYNNPVEHIDYQSGNFIVTTRAGETYTAKKWCFALAWATSDWANLSDCTCRSSRIRARS